VTARIKPGKKRALSLSIREGTLGAGSVAGDEYLRNMAQARIVEDGKVRWVEVCFCKNPLLEERPYWEKYFELLQVKDAHDQRRCRDRTGEEPWACCNCDCSQRLEQRMEHWGKPFRETIEEGEKED